MKAAGLMPKLCAQDQLENILPAVWHEKEIERKKPCFMDSEEERVYPRVKVLK